MLMFTAPQKPASKRRIISTISLGLILASCNLPINSGTATPAVTGTVIASTPLGQATPNSPHGTATPIPAATVPVELSSLKDTNIRIIHPFTGEAGVVFSRLINEFNNENIWKIKVGEEKAGSVAESARVFRENLKSSDRLDMAAIPPDYLDEWNANGDIVDLSAFLTNPEWGMPEKERSAYFPQMMKTSTGSPVISLPAQVNLQFMVYNQTWANELGFKDAPRTQSEFTEQVCEAARVNNQDNTKDNDGTGGWVINSSSPTLLSWINAFGGSKAWTGGTNIALNQDETGEAFTYLRELTEKGCAWNSRVASPFTYFASRQALVISATLPDLMELEETLSFTKNTDKWFILAYPGKNQPSNALISGIAYGITRTRPANELASWLFVRWLSLPKNQARLAEASGMLPPTTAAVDLMNTFAESHPWWTEAAKMLPEALALPASREWHPIRPVLEDSFWQVLQPTPLPIPTLLEQMDETIKTIPTSE
jgi:ABC-type glycerol-3-phosphate transport system substrate-binding protein